MTVKIDRDAREFPRSASAEKPANAWGSQWQHLKSLRPLVRSAGRLRKLGD